MPRKLPAYAETAEQKQAKKKAEITNRLEIRTRQDWQDVLKTPAGRRVLWTILDQFCVNERSAFSDNSTVMAYLNGKRDVATAIRTCIMRYSRQGIYQMEEEHKTDILQQQKELNETDKKEKDNV